MYFNILYTSLFNFKVYWFKKKKNYNMPNQGFELYVL